LVNPAISSQPTAKDLFLLIEIADSSLLYDLINKKNEYEAAGIREYWVVDVQDKAVFRFQYESGKYTGLGAKGAGELPVHTFPQVKIMVDEIFQ
jgi:Uma2 family endonuclease